MRVLLAHNFYRSAAPSGEDVVYANEKRLLEQKNDVFTFERYNDTINDTNVLARFAAAGNGVWSFRTYREMCSLIRDTRPDVAHFHNTFPLISVSAYAACHDNGVAVVQTMHNYRFACANGMLFRDGRPCESCLGASPLPAIWRRCYRKSILASSAQVMALMHNRIRSVYTELVDRYIALTRFVAEKMAKGGLPPDRIEIKPNFLPCPPAPGDGGGGYALYVGRLSEEKGLKTLVNAWRRTPDIPLKIVGDGPMRTEISKHVSGGRIEVLGRRHRDDVFELMREAQFVIVPSEWYEPFGMVVIEAFACGTPVLAARSGGIQELITEGVTGMTFAPGDISDLADKVHRMKAALQHDIGMRRNARAEYERTYTDRVNYEMIMDIYRRARTAYCARYENR